MKSFDKATIKIFNLKTRNIDVVLSGLIGNNDMEGQQYDSDNGDYSLLQINTYSTKTNITAMRV